MRAVATGNPVHVQIAVKLRDPERERYEWVKGYPLKLTADPKVGMQLLEVLDVLLDQLGAVGAEEVLRRLRNASALDQRQEQP